MNGHGRMGWRGAIKGCGRRMTVPREIIISVLSDATEHLSAEDIYFRIHETNPAIGLTTVYRTLELLTQMRVLNKFDFGDKRSRYELTDQYSDKKHHHHLVCTKCGRIVDYSDFAEGEACSIACTEKELSKKYDFTISSHHLSFFGTCPDCKEKNNEL